MTSPSLPSAVRGGDDDLADPMEPGRSVPGDVEQDAHPRGDLRWASWVALISGVGVLLWYISILVLGGVYLAEFSTPAQVAVWVLAAVAFGCGIACLNARRYREFAAAGFIAGVVSLLVSLTIGLPTGFQVLW